MSDITPPADDKKQRNIVIAASAAAIVVIIVIIFFATRHHSAAVVVTTSPSPAPSPTATLTLAPSHTLAPSSPSAIPTLATPTPTNAAQGPSSAVAVAKILFPDNGNNGTACGAGLGYNGCPVTAQMMSALIQWTTNQPSSEALCRCSTKYIAPTSYADDPGALPAGYQGQSGYDAVDVRLRFNLNPPHYEHMIVLAQQLQDGKWIAFDTYCDNPQNLITSQSPTVCSIGAS